MQDGTQAAAGAAAGATTGAAQSAQEYVSQGLAAKGGGAAGGGAAGEAGKGAGAAAGGDAKPGEGGEGQEQAGKEKAAGKDGGGGEKIELTRAELTKLIAEEVGKASKGQQGENARSRFIIQNMADLPAIFHDLIPATTDTKVMQSRYSEFADAINKVAMAHIKKMGLKIPDVGGANRDGGITQTRATADTSKMSANQLVSEGLAEQQK